MERIWDCIVIGGGSAGLSAALVLGRARRRTLVIDEGRPSNLAAHGIGGLLGSDGRPPGELYAAGRDELEAYPSAEVRFGRAVDAATDGSGFTVELADGGRLHARRLLLATGMTYRMPQVRGLDELWGTSVFHCPFCHGWEVRDRPLAVLARGERAMHSAMMLRAWSDDIVVLTDGSDGLHDDQRERLATAGIGIDEREIVEFAARNGGLDAIVFADGQRLPRAAALVATTLHQRSPLVEHLGVAFDPPGPLSDESVAVDGMQRTSVPGVFAAGDVSAAMPQVAAAIASGSLAATAVVASLLGDDVGLPVPPWPTIPNTASHQEDSIDRTEKAHV